jgi:hypothetical protein
MFGFISRFINYIKWLYMQYLLNTALYMLEPSEIKLFNFIVLLVVLLSVYSTYVFLPTQILRILSWINNDVVMLPLEA